MMHSVPCVSCEQPAEQRLDPARYGVLAVCEACREASPGDYEAFVARKLALTPPTGLANVPELHPSLFSFQRSLVTWALRRGRAALFADTGLGKTAMQLEWARHAGQRVLILAPLAVAAQTAREGARMGLDVNVCREDVDIRDGINVTNYDRLHKFDPTRFDAVVLDECFAAGTLVNTPAGLRPIESIRVGDPILNASGVDAVSSVHRREVPYGVRVTVRGRVCIASPNHPFFTQRGWVGARDLRGGDFVLEAAAALPMVRQGVQSEVADVATQQILRDVLLSELADEHAGAQGESAQRTGFRKEGDHAGQALPGESDRGDGCEQGTVRGTGPQQDTGNAGAYLSAVERGGPRTFRAWGQWSRNDIASILAAGGTWVAMASGICLVTGPAEARLPDTLQARLGELRNESVHRGGWSLASGDESSAARREEDRDAAFARVDGVEILEPGHPELERLRSADGKLYFHDIGATRHPSFAVNGLLVHNSSIIKHHDAKTLRSLLDAFARTPFKLCATATPSPNDYTELGTHAEFLGVCTRAEMLAEFFVHDGGETQTWRLKGHARQAFWRWVAAWGALVRKPSDLGMSDAGYDLPPLHVEQHVLPADPDTVRLAGLLFAAPAGDLTERRNARRASIAARVAECVGRVLAEPTERWIVWVDLNAEQDAIADALGDECVSIYGSLDADEKERRLTAFVNGQGRILLTKASIAGQGINLQSVARMAFVGVTDSYEAYYQAVRRIWRFGQTRECAVHIYASEVEGSVVANLERKARDAEKMADELSRETREALREEVLGTTRATNTYAPSVAMTVPAWVTSEEAAA